MATLSTEAIQAFQEYKLRGNGSYLIYQLSGKGQIEVTKKGTDPIEWEAFAAVLPSDQACWAVKSFQYETKEGGKRSKCLLIQVIQFIVTSGNNLVDSRKSKQKRQNGICHVVE